MLIMMYQVKTLIGLNISVFILMAGQGMITVLLPQRVMELGVSESSTGYLASAFALTYILVQVPMGRFSDRFSYKPFIISGYLLLGLAGLLYYFANSAGVIFAGRMVHGMGEAPVWALAAALLSLHYPAVKGRVLGLYNAALHLGFTAGPLLGLAALHWRPGRFQFLLYAVISFLGALLIWLLVSDSSGVKPARKDLQYGHIMGYLKQKSILSVLAGVVLYGGGYGLFVSTIPAFLIRTKGFSQPAIGLYFTLLFFCLGLSQLIAGPVGDRWGHRRFMMAGLGLSGAFLLPFPEMSYPAIYLSLIPAGLGLGMFAVASLVFLNGLAGDSHKGEMSGLYYLAWALGYFGLPLIGAQTGHSRGLALFFHVYAGLVILAALLPSNMVVKSDRKRL